MDFRYLKAFYFTARFANFTRAAKELKVAQSAVSRQIRLLEESLNVQLLLRTPSGVSLTPKGQELFQQVKGFHDWGAEFEGKTQIPVRIASMEGVASYWLPQRLSLIKGSNISVDITVGSAESVRTLAERSEVDFALTTERLQSAFISSRRLFRESMVAISSSKIRRSDLEDSDWVYVDRASYLSKIGGKKPKRFIRAGTFAGMLEYVRQGFGVAIAPRHLIKDDENLHVLELSEFRDEWIHLATLNYEIVPENIRRVRQILVES